MALSAHRERQLDSIRSVVEDIPNVRLGAGISNRNEQIMTWRLPNGSSVQMYMNPTSLVVDDTKEIKETRTKGGFVVQYWGENLTTITLSGTTGSAGIEGINVLRDVYRAELKAFDSIALANERTNLSVTDPGEISSLVKKMSSEQYARDFILRPTLGAMASSILLFYQGVQYKGYFKSFKVTEAVEKLGHFDYVMGFTATETRGRRSNFMAWHKNPIADDLVGNLLTGLMNKASAGISSFMGSPHTVSNPEQFHPENAPLSFGGSTLAAMLGIDLDNQSDRNL